ncbi:MAG: hypothetical protein IPM69_13610 [Ignavibacteria bacterium]|nr:hypothetical protein [Ignavibacteria bacterium]
MVPYSDRHLSKPNNTVVNLDFSSVKRINSSGSKITLTKLISLLEGKDYLFKLVMPEAENNLFVERHLQKSCFLNILDQKVTFEKENLFETIKINKQPEAIIEYDEIQNIKKTSFPIFHLKYNKNNDREIVDEFSNWITDVLIDNLSVYNVKKINVFLTIITELAKNSQDHTGKDAFWGLDMIENLNSKTGEILFMF